MFPYNAFDCEQSLELNQHMGAELAMAPGRVNGLEGAKTIVLSYKTVAGAVATIIKHVFLITCYKEDNTGRLRLDATLTLGFTAGAQPRAKTILIYDATPHPVSDLNPTKCGPGTTPRDKQAWASNMLKQVEHQPYVQHTTTHHEGANTTWPQQIDTHR